MSNLPKPELPQYSHTLTGLGKTIKFRPFTTKEQKILLLAKETQTYAEVIDAITQILENCIIDDISIPKLPIFDVEDLFLRIRSKSVSNESTFVYRIKDTDERVNVTINLDDVKVKTFKDNKNKIMLTETIGVKINYPTLTSFKLSEDDMILSCIEYVFDEDEVYTFSDFSTEDQMEWLESFDAGAIKNIKEFFDTMPILKYETYVESKDGKKYDIVLSGIEDFFI